MGGGGGGEAWGSQTLWLVLMPVNGKCGTSTGARVHPGEARDGDVGHPCDLNTSCTIPADALFTGPNPLTPLLIPNLSLFS